MPGNSDGICKSEILPYGFPVEVINECWQVSAKCFYKVVRYGLHVSTVLSIG